MYPNFENLDITQFFHVINTNQTIAIVSPIVVYLLLMIFSRRK